MPGRCVGRPLREEKPCAWGHIGILSFGGSKLLSAGRGGRRSSTSRRFISGRNYGCRGGVQQWAALSELQAIVLLPQLAAKLSEHTAYRSNQVELLRRYLDAGLRLFHNSAESNQSAYYKVGFWFDAAAFGLSREVFVKATSPKESPSTRDSGLCTSAVRHRFRAHGTLVQRGSGPSQCRHAASSRAIAGPPMPSRRLHRQSGKRIVTAIRLRGDEPTRLIRLQQYS